MLDHQVTRAYTPDRLWHTSQTNLLCTRDRIVVLPYPNLTSLQQFPGKKSQQGPKTVRDQGPHGPIAICNYPSFIFLKFSRDINFLPADSGPHCEKLIH